MKLLLDTCTFLWIIQDADNLTEKVKALFTDPANEIYLSSVSIWEAIVKYQLGRLPLPNDPARFMVEQRKLHRIESLAVDEDAIMQLSRLPEYHKDPFDRLLICQAIANGLILLTPDKDIQHYPIPTLW